MIGNVFLVDMHSLVHNCSGVLGVKFGSNLNFGEFLESLHNYVRGESYTNFRT